LINNYSTSTSPSRVDNSQVDIVALESTVLSYLGREDFIDRDETWRKHFKKNIVNLYGHLDLQATIFLIAVHDAIAEHWYLMTADTRSKLISVIDSLTPKKGDILKLQQVKVFKEYMELNCKASDGWTVDVAKIVLE
jgi:hypothetical protein